MISREFRREASFPAPSREDEDIKPADPEVYVSVVRYQEELPVLISSRPNKHLTLSELVKLMEWKLTVRAPPVSSANGNSYNNHSVEQSTYNLSFNGSFLGLSLQRGKFRPRLQQLVASNSEDTVQKCSIKAFSLLPDVQAAIAELSTLKGVGPATASGLHFFFCA
ncbi:hypothetical protein GOODEAATRI_012272 [Goodea atripinnis]|uniref:Uncharacterized protein n=1 Tax=Goodea atripinnis TaxID=208336 RepID=A0ABV0PMX2_9TELE